MILESPEGFWLGSFGLIPVLAELLEEAKDEQQATWGPWKNIPQSEITSETLPADPNVWRLTNEGVLGDYSDLKAVFGGNFDGKKVGLKVVSSESQFFY